MVTDASSLFTREEARSYWNRRHQELDSLRSGGNTSYDFATNAMLYAVRAGRLVEVLGGFSDPDAPLRVLDAGCGKGHFSRVLAEFGHRVDGIDTSPSAVVECRRRGGPGQSFALASLTTWSPPHLYDVVVCIDVLYHLTEDDEWEASVRHLASLVRFGGRIGLVDHDTDEDRVWNRYQKTRARSSYRRLLEDCGFEVTGFVPNNFRDDPSGMHVAVRVS